MDFPSLTVGPIAVHSDRFDCPVQMRLRAGGIATKAEKAIPQNCRPFRLTAESEIPSTSKSIPADASMIVGGKTPGGATQAPPRCQGGLRLR